MPSTPYVVNGTITNESSSIVASVIVTAHNTTNSERITTTSNSIGRYVLDLANLTSGYTIGDSITIYVRFDGYTGETTFTLSGEGGVEKNVSTANQVTFATLRNSLWKAFYDTLQTGTFEISTNNIFSAMNDKIVSNIGYPIVIIYPPDIDREGINLQNTSLECKTSFTIEIYHTSSENVKVLADEVENKVWLAQEVWDGLNLKGLKTPGIDIDWYEEGNKKIHIISFGAEFVYDGVVVVP